MPQATIHAIPMRPADKVLGALTLYQSQSQPAPSLLEPPLLLTLAAFTGAALIRDPSALDEDLDQGPWDSRAKVHQATGIVVAQLSSMEEAFSHSIDLADRRQISLGDTAAAAVRSARK